MKTKSELANKIYKSIKDNKKCTIKKIYKGKDAVQGSRMINKFDALKGNMPIYKFVGNIFFISYNINALPHPTSKTLELLSKL